MAGYVKLQRSIWQDNDFRQMAATTQRLYLLLISQPDLSHCGILPITAARWSTLAADTTSSEIRHDLELLAAARFIVIDHDTEELWVRSYMVYDGGHRTPNIQKAMMNALAAIMSPTIREQAFRVAETLGVRVTETLGETLGERVTETLGETLGERVTETLGETLGERVTERVASSLQPTTYNLQPPPPPAQRQSSQHTTQADNPVDNPRGVRVVIKKTAAHIINNTGRTINNRAAYTKALEQRIQQQHPDIAELLTQHDPDQVANIIIQRETKPDHPHPQHTTPQAQHNPNCPHCAGSGWRTLNHEHNTVTPCDCHP